jgi:Uma2 family endonuclease
MVEALSSPKSALSFNDFLAQYRDRPELELIDGELIELEPTGPHEQVGGVIARKLNVEIDRLDLPYVVLHHCLIQPFSPDTALRPDVIILDERELPKEPLWQREPVITLGPTIQLVAEVVSSNWQNDYARKFDEYEALGIPEYWIVDYLGLGGREYIGRPKQPTVTICSLIDGLYQRSLYRRNEMIQSASFPELKISTNQY